MPKLLNFGQLLKKAFSAYRSVFMSILPLVIASVILDNLFSFIKHYKPTLQPYIKLHTLGIILSLPLSILQPIIYSGMIYLIGTLLIGEKVTIKEALDKGLKKIFLTMGYYLLLGVQLIGPFLLILWAPPSIEPLLIAFLIFAYIYVYSRMIFGAYFILFDNQSILEAYKSSKQLYRNHVGLILFITIFTNIFWLLTSIFSVAMFSKFLPIPHVDAIIFRNIDYLFSTPFTICLVSSLFFQLKTDSNK